MTQNLQIGFKYIDESKLFNDPVSTVNLQKLVMVLWYFYKNSTLKEKEFTSSFVFRVTWYILLN